MREYFVCLKLWGVLGARGRGRPRRLGDDFEAFARDGWDCVGADTDALAYRELERAPESFAVLVADLNLGRGATGFDVARQARFRNPEIAVVYISGEGDADIRRFGVWGAERLGKPIRSLI